MRDPLRVGRRQAVGDLNRELEHLRERHPAAGKSGGQRLAFEVFHHQEADALVGSDVVQGADVRVIQLRNRFRLEGETSAEAWVRGGSVRQHFECDQPIESRVARPVDLAHAAGAEQPFDGVGSEQVSGVEAHGAGAKRIILQRRLPIRSAVFLEALIGSVVSCSTL